MKTLVLDLNGFIKKISLKNILLICGILSSLLYISFDLYASWQYDGYNYKDQCYSELLATGAPTRFFMIIASIVYNTLVSLFAIGVWKSGYPKRVAHLTSCFILLYALLSMVIPSFYQMDMRNAEITANGSLHGPMTALMSLFIMLSLSVGAFLFGWWFRIYSFVTIIILILFGVLTSLYIPQLESGQPTPYMGIMERINIYATMLWFALLAIGLLPSEKNKLQLSIS